MIFKALIGDTDISNYIEEIDKTPQIKRNEDFSIVAQELSLTIKAAGRFLFDWPNMIDELFYVKLNNRNIYKGRIRSIDDESRSPIDLTIKHIFNDLKSFAYFLNSFDTKVIAPVKPWEVYRDYSDGFSGTYIDDEEFECTETINTSSTFSVKITSEFDHFKRSKYRGETDGSIVDRIEIYCNHDSNNCNIITGGDLSSTNPFYENQSIQIVNFAADPHSPLEPGIYFVHLVDATYFQLRSSYNGSIVDIFNDCTARIRFLQETPSELDTLKIESTGTPNRYRLKSAKPYLSTHSSTKSMLYAHTNSSGGATIKFKYSVEDKYCFKMPLESVIKISHLIESIFWAIGFDLEYDFDPDGIFFEEDPGSAINSFNDCYMSIGHLFAIGKDFIVNPKAAEAFNEVFGNEYAYSEIVESDDIFQNLTWFDLLSLIAQKFALSFYISGDKIRVTTRQRDGDGKLLKYDDSLKYIDNLVPLRVIKKREIKKYNDDNIRFLSYEALYGNINYCDFKSDTDILDYFRPFLSSGIVQGVNKENLHNNFRIMKIDSGVYHYLSISRLIKNLYSNRRYPQVLSEATINVPIRVLNDGVNSFCPKSIEYDLESSEVEIIESISSEVL